MGRLASLAQRDVLRYSNSPGTSTFIVPQSAGLLGPHYGMNMDEDDEPVTIVDNDPFLEVQNDLRVNLRSIRDSIKPSRAPSIDKNI